MKLSTSLLASVLALSTALPASSSDHGVKFLPFVGPRLEAARYAPADSEFAWVGWIGASVDLLQKDRWSVYFNPNFETILGHRIRSFEAIQANYSLEVGLSFQGQRVRVSPFLHHVSRHVQDRDKFQAVDWNFLGVRADAPWPASWSRRGAVSASVAVATLASAVEYNWEARVWGDVDLWRQGPRGVFLLADIRHVGAAATPEFPREGFTDLRAEVGFRYFGEASRAALFVAYEHRNDALIPRSLVTDRALFGFRIRGEKRLTPTDPRP